jgi:hypothetical protein
MNFSVNEGQRLLQKIEEGESDTCTRPDGTNKSVAAVDSDCYPIDCRLPDLYVPQSCWQHARNNTVPPEEEVRVGLPNYALVLWIIVIIAIRCTFFFVCVFLKWHQSMTVFQLGAHFDASVRSKHTYSPNSFLAILLNSLAFFLLCYKFKILVWRAAGSACSYFL